ncbi:hypothetical protein [Streptomyces sp. NPDC054794]
MADMPAMLLEQDLRALGQAMRTALPIVQRMLQAAPQPRVPGTGSAS